MPPNSIFDFKCFCAKLFILFLIHGARIKQTLTPITVENVILDHENVILLPNNTLNHSGPFVYHSYKENAKLCIVYSFNFI